MKLHGFDAVGDRRRRRSRITLDDGGNYGIAGVEQVFRVTHVTPRVGIGVICVSQSEGDKGEGEEIKGVKVERKRRERERSERGRGEREREKSERGRGERERSERERSDGREVKGREVKHLLK